MVDDFKEDKNFVCSVCGRYVWEGSRAKLVKSVDCTNVCIDCISGRSGIRLDREARRKYLGSSLYLDLKLWIDS